jgi:hypothetical protein
MADPDTIVQKVVQKYKVFDIDFALPNLPKRLNAEFKTLMEDAHKSVFRRIWEKATPEERKSISLRFSNDISKSSRREYSGSNSNSRESGGSEESGANNSDKRYYDSSLSGGDSRSDYSSGED